GARLAVLGCAAGDVHGRPPQTAGAGRPALAHRVGGAGGRAHHRAQREADRGPDFISNVLIFTAIACNYDSGNSWRKGRKWKVAKAMMGRWCPSPNIGYNRTASDEKDGLGEEPCARSVLVCSASQ